MSSFFDPPPPPPELPGRPWAGKRDAVIGRTVALNLALGRSEKAALWIPALTAYADAFEFDVELRHDLDEDELAHPFFDAYYRRRRRNAPEGLAPELLRFGIQFSDGRKATNLEGPVPHGKRGEQDEPEKPVLSARGGGGGDGRWRQEFRVSPLPPDGPLAFVCEWPAAGIPETRAEIDSALILAAAADAHPVWPDAEPGGDSSSTGYTSSRHMVFSSRDEPSEPDDDAAA